MPIIFFGGGGFLSFLFFILFVRFIVRLFFSARNSDQNYEDFYRQYQQSNYYRSSYQNQAGYQSKPMADPYTVLGITREATEADIKKAYRKLIREYHPDTVEAKDEAQKEQATKRFREIQEAYERICNERGIK